MIGKRKAEVLSGEIKRFVDIEKGDIFKLIEGEETITNWLECTEPRLFENGVNMLRATDIILDIPELLYSIKVDGNNKLIKDIEEGDIFQLLDKDYNIIYLHNYNLYNSWFMCLNVSSIDYNGKSILKVQVKRLPTPPDPK